MQRKYSNNKKFIEFKTRLTQQETSIMNDNYMKFVGCKTFSSIINERCHVGAPLTDTVGV